MQKAAGGGHSVVSDLISLPFCLKTHLYNGRFEGVVVN
jgi:hypothetical protein